MPAVPDVNLDENVDGSPYDVCLWHLADQVALSVRGPKLGDKQTLNVEGSYVGASSCLADRCG
jgi:hypothetical protein